MGELTNLETLLEPAFNPPRNPRRRRGGRTTTGTRRDSCVGDSETAFTALGPEATAGLTSSSRPTFVWYLPDSDKAYPVTFRLLMLNDEDSPEVVFKETDLLYTSGYSVYSLPPQVEDLSTGVRYRWQVIVQCDINYPSRSLVQELSLEVVNLPAGLNLHLAAAESSAARALLYGRAEFWYDAIAQVANGQTDAEKTIRHQLIQDLAALEIENSALAENLLNIAARPL